MEVCRCHLGSGESARSELIRRDDAEPAPLIIIDRLGDLGSRVHDEWPIVLDRLSDRKAAEDEDVERFGIVFL